MIQIKDSNVLNGVKTCLNYMAKHTKNQTTSTFDLYGSYVSRSEGGNSGVVSNGDKDKYSIFFIRCNQ